MPKSPFWAPPGAEGSSQTVCPSFQQHQHYRGTHYKCKVAGPTHHPPVQRVWAGGPVMRASANPQVILMSHHVDFTLPVFTFWLLFSCFPGPPSFSQIPSFPRNCCKAHVPVTSTCLRHLLCVPCFQLGLQDSVLCPGRPMALASPVLHTALYPGPLGVPLTLTLGFVLWFALLLSQLIGSLAIKMVASFPLLNYWVLG